MKAFFAIRSAERQAFSLLELLIVVAVISVLATLVVQSISSPAAAQLTTAGNETVDLINHTRQYAQANNTLAMLAVINSGSDAGRVLGSFAFAATNGTNGAWTQIDRWRTLPEVVHIDLPGSTNALTTPPSPVPSLQRGGSTVGYVAATFLPDGRPYTTNSQPPVLWLRHPANSSGSQANFYKIILNESTGTPFIRRP